MPRRLAHLTGHLMRTILLVTLLLAACSPGGDAGAADSDAVAEAEGSASGDAGQIVDSSHVAAAIDAQVTALTDAYRRGDASAAAEVYAEDGVLRSLEGPASDAYGRAAIEASYERFFQRTPSVGADFSIIVLRVWTDSATAEGRFDLRFGDGSDAPEPTLGAFQHRWHRQPDGTWRIVEDRASLDEGDGEDQ